MISTRSETLLSDSSVERVIYNQSWQKQLYFGEWSHWNSPSVHYLLFFLISDSASPEYIFNLITMGNIQKAS